MQLTGYSSQSDCDSDVWDNEVMTEQFSGKPMYLEIYQFQVSGKTPKYINNVNGRIYKEFSDTEHAFYELLYSLEEGDVRGELKKHLPQYHGVEGIETLGKLPQFKQVFEGDQKQEKLSKREEWVRHISARNQGGKRDKNKFIIMRNLTYKYGVPNIMDLKLGTKKAKKSNVKFAKSTTNSHKFRINGMMVGLKKGDIFEECFVSKYFGQSITFQETEKYLSLFFFNGISINTDLLKRILIRLAELIDCFKQFKGAKFLSSSLFLCYDGENPERWQLRLIDFDKYQLGDPQVDENILEGLKNIHIFFSNIVDKAKEYQDVLINRQLQIFHHNGPVIPMEKVKKYEQGGKEEKAEADD